ncbi:hypothetical protein [Sorangium sp. So ce1153]|uniref:hypothetical protein n=1 Tax=Sorangium sp. So ce1153 TaxID=3133333 RepID=UPI003F6215E3
MKAAGQPQKISVFPIAPPRDLYAQKGRIQQAVLAAINPELPSFVTPEYDFTIDPVCGWIRYALRTDLWNANPKSALPEDERSATAAAQEFIARLAAKCREPEYRALGIPPLLPVEALATIAAVSTVVVNHPDLPWPDHWLCRFVVRIKSPSQKDGHNDGHDDLTVMGATIDIRVGHKSKVVGFVSHWRPVWLDRAVAAKVLPQAPSDAPPPSLVYVVAGENSPQKFLAPYYYSVTGHDGEILPASSHSFTVSMRFAQKEEGGAYVLPAIVGSSDDYTTSWAYWRPDSAFDEGLVSMGRAEFIELPPGVYNVMLHVEDNQTGAVVLCERMAYVKAAAEVPTALAPIV